MHLRLIRPYSTLTRKTAQKPTNPLLLALRQPKPQSQTQRRAQPASITTKIGNNNNSNTKNDPKNNTTMAPPPNTKKRARPQSFQDRMAAFKSRVLKTDQPSSATKNNNNNNNNNQNKGKNNNKKKVATIDPSTKYISNPASAPLVRQAKTFIKDKLGVSPTITVGAKEGWRTSAKLSVRGTPTVMGMFAPGSHDIVELLSSRAHHPAINRATKLLNDALQELKVPGYDGVNRGGLSYAAFNVELAESGKVQMTLVFNSDEQAEMSVIVSRIAEHIAKVDDSVLHSVWLHCNPASRHDNCIFARSDVGTWLKVIGREHIVDRLGIEQEDDAATDNAEQEKGEPKREESSHTSRQHMNKRVPRLYFSPFVFRQANIAGFGEIVKQIRKWIPQDSPVVELYGGVGTIGLHLLDKCSSLFCSDENPHNEACFRRSLNGLPSDLQAKATYRTAGAARVALDGGLSGQKVLVVDPPRKGLDKEVLNAVKNTPELERVVYVSCGFNALCRDWEALEGMGMKAVHAEGHVLFPGADHLETLAVFDRVG